MSQSSLVTFARATFMSGDASRLPRRPAVQLPFAGPRWPDQASPLHVSHTGLAAAVDKQIARLRPAAEPLPAAAMDAGALISAEFASAIGDGHVASLQKAVGRALAKQYGARKGGEYLQRLKFAARSESAWPDAGASWARAGVLSVVPRR